MGTGRTCGFAFHTCNNYSCPPAEFGARLSAAAVPLHAYLAARERSLLPSPFPAPTPELSLSPDSFLTIVDAERGHCSLRTRGGLESSFRVSFRTDTSAPTSTTPIHTLQLSLPAVVAVCGTCTSVLSRGAVGCDAVSSPRLIICTSFRPVWPARSGSQATCTP